MSDRACSFFVSFVLSRGRCPTELEPPRPTRDPPADDKISRGGTLPPRTPRACASAQRCLWLTHTCVWPTHVCLAREVRALKRP